MPTPEVYSSFAKRLECSLNDIGWKFWCTIIVIAFIPAATELFFPFIGGFLGRVLAVIVVLSIASAVPFYAFRNQVFPYTSFYYKVWSWVKSIFSTVFILLCVWALIKNVT
jgi:hypothetical protein